MCVQRGLLFALLALFSTDVLAQGISLPEIVVPAGSTDTPPLPAGSGERQPPAAASEVVITREEVLSQPVMRPGEVLEQAPGLIVTQHSGEGKANQYFLRVSLSQIKSVRIDDAVLQARVDLRYAHGTE